MKKQVYLDTSAFFKLFLPEEGYGEVERLLTLAKDGKLQVIISEWVVNEAAAAVERKVSQEKIDDQDAHDIHFAMANFLEDNYQSRTVLSYAITEKVVLASRNVIEKMHVNASDALHVLIALSSQCDYFASADKELNDKIKKSGVSLRVLDIHEKKLMLEFFEDIENS